MAGGKAVAALGLVALGVAGWLVLRSYDAGPSAPRPLPAAGAGSGAAAKSDERAAATAAPGRTAEAGTVSGLLVRSRNDMPIPGTVRVTTASGASATASAGANGWFRVAGLPFDTDLSLEASSPGLLPYRNSGIRIRPGEDLDVGRLSLSPAIPFEVRVQDPEGKPIAGARLVVLRTANWRDENWQFRRLHVEAEATADAEGRALFAETGAGLWLLEGWAEGRGRVRDQLQLVEGVAQEPRLLVLGPGCALHGRVLLGDRPAVGAEVSVLQQRFGRFYAPGRIAGAVVDGEGRYRVEGLASGDCTLAVRTLGNVTEQAGPVTLAGETERDILLPARAELRGRVLDAANGNGVAGATVGANLSSAEGGSFDASGTTRTDATGAFALPGLPATRVTQVSVQAAGYLAEPGGGGAVEPAVGVLESGRTAEVVVRVVRGVPVRGVVRDPAGKPVTYAWVDLSVARTGGAGELYSLPNVQSDGDGRYVVPAAPPGRGYFRAGARNLHLPGMSSDAAAVLASGDAPPGNVVEIPESGEAVKDLDLVPDCRVEGRFQFRDGKPAPGLLPVLLRAGEDEWEEQEGAPSAEDGAFVIDDMAPDPRDYLVVARGSAGEFGRSEAFALTESAAVTGLVVQVAGPGSVQGRVRRADGKPPAGATVRLFSARPGELNSWRWRVSAREAGTKPVAADGTFTAEGLAPGTWVALASAPGCVDGTSAEVTVAEGERTSGVEVLLEAEKSIAGRVTDAGGAPIGGARVTVRRFVPPEPVEAEENSGVPAGDVVVVDGSGPMVIDAMGNDSMDTTSANDGTFRIGGLRDGAYTVTADARGRSPASVQAQAGAEGVVLALPEGLSIEGRVVEAANGKPIANIAVRAFGESNNVNFDSEDMQTHSGTDGGFTIRGLPEGTYQIHVGTEGGWEEWASKVQRGVAAGAKGLVVALEKGLPLGGRVVDASGGRLDVRGLVIRVESRVPGSGWSNATEVPADGAFRFRGLPSGRYRVGVGGRYWGEPSVYVATEVDAEAGATDLVLRVVRGKSIAGRIVLPAGSQGDVALWTRAASGDRKPRPVEVGEDGSFETEPLEDGVAQDLFATVGEGQVASALGVAPGTRGVVLEPKAGGTISGKVLRPDGAAAPGGLTVFARSAGGDTRRLEVRTEADGSFRFEGLLPGSYRVAAYGALANIAPVLPAPAVPVGTTGLEVRTQAGRVLKVRIREASGAATDIEHAIVRVTSEEEDETVSIPVHEGLLVIPSLPPCKVRVKPWRNGDPWDEDPDAEGWFGPYEVPGPDPTITLPAAK